MPCDLATFVAGAGRGGQAEEFGCCLQAINGVNPIRFRLDEG
jgi:hypothetical protein